MILTRLTLTNYKQYIGEHHFDVAEDATIGVVGANGVGKTTIFEALEWCLYNPRSIKNDNIRPRGIGGEVRVVAQLETSDGSAVYDVERILKRGGVQAAIYRIDELGGSEPVVQGTRDVTDYISSRLIGLGHAAFVATFFTRQKELSFFGDMKPTERRHEVGKLLGFETIKQAQTLIGADRQKARADAEALQDRYDAMVADRDLVAEITEARESASSLLASRDTARTALETAEQATVATEDRLQQLQALRDRDLAIASEIRDRETRLQHARERDTDIVTNLERLDHRAVERDQQASIALVEPALRAELARLETERERHQRRERILADVASRERAIASSIQDARALVDDARNATTEPDWVWSDLDTCRPLDALDRLIGAASRVDLANAESRLAMYVAAGDWQRQFDTETATLQRYRDLQAQLKAGLDEELRAGEPSTSIEALDARLSMARTHLAEVRARLATLEQQAAASRELAAKLEQQHFEESCPTCGRPFSDAEADLVLQTLRGAIRQHEQEIAKTGESARNDDATIRRTQQEISDERQRDESVRTLRSRIANGDERIADQATMVDAKVNGLRAALAQLGIDAPPSSEQVDTLQFEVHHARTMLGTVQPLGMIRRTIADAQDAKTRQDAELEALAHVSWDPEAWRDVTERHQAATNAASAVRQIDQELAKRPGLEQDLESVRSQIATLETDLVDHATARRNIGFDPKALAEATASFQESRQLERERRATLEAAGNQARDAEYRVKTLLQEEHQVKELGRDAEEKRKVYKDLDLMYREFSEFDKFVAQRLTPQLADTTSDIVAAMTDGTYDRVEFDEDYGVQVWVGKDEKFDLETFSGGERDAIALAARLALSRMIGSQAANPPGFLVLDEVFGSLDAERRERVLTLLGQHAHEFFRQMFIISHVDDVQQSPVFDTIWQVVQREDGSSDIVADAGERITMD